MCAICDAVAAGATVADAIEDERAVLRRMVADYGWAVVGVGSDELTDGQIFCYTIGLSLLGLPELVMHGGPISVQDIPALYRVIQSVAGRLVEEVRRVAETPEETRAHWQGLRPRGQQEVSLGGLIAPVIVPVHDAVLDRVRHEITANVRRVLEPLVDGDHTYDVWQLVSPDPTGAMPGPGTDCSEPWCRQPRLWDEYEAGTALRLIADDAARLGAIHEDDAA